MPTKGGAKPRYWVLSKPGEPWAFTPSKNCEGGSVAPLEVGTHTLRGHEATIRVDRIGTAARFAELLRSPDLDARAEALAKFPLAYILVEGTLGELMGLDRPYSLLQEFASLTLRFPTVQVMFVGPHGKTYVASFFARLMEREGA